MQIFIEAIDLNIWEAIEIGPYVPTIVDGSSTSGSTTIEKPRDKWSEEDRRRIQTVQMPRRCGTHFNSHMRAQLMLRDLTYEYELFRMKTNENIQDMQKRFTHIVNHLVSLGKTFPNEDLINKVLRCLNRE